MNVASRVLPFFDAHEDCLLRSFGYIGALFSAIVISMTVGAEPTDAGTHAQGWVIAALGMLLFLPAYDSASRGSASRSQRDA